MERTEIKERKIRVVFHHYECDGCGKIVETVEGSEERITSDYKRKMFVGGDYGYLELRKCFCESCKRKMTEKIANALQNLGFCEASNQSAV